MPLRSPVPAILLSLLATCATSAPPHGSPIAAANVLAPRASSAPAGTYWPYQSYHTSPFHPPNLTIERNGQPLAPGYLFFAQGPVNVVAPYNGGAKESAPFIMTDAGDLVWSAPKGTYATNFKVQTYKGEQVLTYWEGIELSGTGIGHYYGAIHILDSSYTAVRPKICPKLAVTLPPNVTHDCRLDAHESLITAKGTLIFTVYNVTAADLSSIKGPVNGYIYDTLFYEMDIDTGEILFEWSAFANIPLNSTTNPIGAAGTAKAPFDAFHINSVEPVGDKYLANFRHTWSTYLIDSTGKIEWTIQGNTGGDFAPLPAGAGFRWQHDARAFNITPTSLTISWFNNYNAAQGNGTAPSNGLLLTLNTTTKTAHLEAAYINPAHRYYSIAQGNFQSLSGGNWLSYYGLTPFATEFGPAGDARWSATFGAPQQIQSYRMYKQPWKGYPTTVPEVAVQRAKGLGYVSWNGATEVTGWVVYEGASEAGLAKGDLVAKTGFETVFGITKGVGCVRVAAYAGSTFLGNSTVNCK